jgi:alpha-tubulin suppressor-like RCC1 family protein
MWISIALVTLALGCGVDTSAPEGPWRAPGQEWSVTALTAGGDHVCATSADGSITCWGANEVGQVQPGAPAAIDRPTRQRSVDVVQVEAGHRGTCRARSDGSVDCDGSHTTYRIPPGAAIVDLAVAQGAVCAVRVDGTLECGGPAPWIQRFVRGGDQTQANAVAVAGFGDRMCRIDREGRVGCWGRGWAGDRTVYDFANPLDGATAVARIALGAVHGCLVTREGQARCWGDNADGQLGIGEAGATARPLDVALSRRVFDIRVGAYRSCALVEDGAFCWGRNRNGLLGDGSTTSRNTPTPLTDARGVLDLALGDAMTCALVPSGHAVCWGADTSGQLGRGRSVTWRTPARVPGLPRASSVGVGRDHLCITTQDGDIWCVGRNTRGQLGDDTQTDAPSGVRANVPVLEDRVEAWGDTTCAYESDGTERCWGEDAPRPTDRIPALTNDPVIVSSASHACGLRDDGLVRCWGDDAFGQAGGGSDTLALPIVLEAPATAIALGPDTSCALLEGGDVACWGRAGFALGAARRGVDAVLGLP